MNDELNRDIWEPRISAPQNVFESLLIHHNQTLMEFANKTLDQSDEEFFESLEVMLLDAESDWYTKPTKDLEQSVITISKGFALDAFTISGFFKDNYMAEDLKEVLKNPEATPESYPSPVHFSSAFFIKAIHPNLSKEIFEQNEEFYPYSPEGLESLGSFTFEQCSREQTPLVWLMEAQKLEKFMKVAATDLKNNKKHSLASIAEAYATKAAIISNDIITRVQHAGSLGISIDEVMAAHPTSNDNEIKLRP